MKTLFLLVLCVCLYAEDDGVATGGIPYNTMAAQCRLAMDSTYIGAENIGKNTLCMSDSSYWKLIDVEPNKWKLLYIKTEVPCSLVVNGELYEEGKIIISVCLNNVNIMIPEMLYNNKPMADILTIRFGRLSEDLYNLATLYFLPLTPAAVKSNGDLVNGFIMLTNREFHIMREYLYDFESSAGIYKTNYSFIVR